MKALLINGSPRNNGNTFIALSEAAKALNENGVETEILPIGTRAVQGCIACYKCAELGRCVFGDDLYNKAREKSIEADAIIIGSPTYYAGPNGSLCALLDRLFFSCREHLQYKPGAAVAVCRRGGASAAFERLNKYFLISNMHVVGSQYWNQVHDFTPDDALKDKEGLQTMRTLGENMAWLLKCIDAGKKSGVTFPEHEPRIRTHFIK